MREPAPLVAALLPHPGTLGEPELVRLAEAVPAAVDVRSLLGDAASPRAFVPLLSSDEVEVWAIAWRDSADTGFHDHDRSAGAVPVLSGTLVEERLVPGRPVSEPLGRVLSSGTSFSFDAAHVHRIRSA